MTREGTAPDLVLASSSPRRAAILEQLGLDFRVASPAVDEAVEPGEPPDGAAERLARRKAASVSTIEPEALVLAGDTLVVSGAGILEKPTGPEDAVSTLLELAGGSHRVVSGLAVAGPGGAVASGVSRTRVTFRPFGAEEARAYVATGEPLDKAGAYGIQGRGAALVRSVEGDYNAVVGLPTSLLVELLDEVGWRYLFHGLVRATSD